MQYARTARCRGWSLERVYVAANERCERGGSILKRTSLCRCRGLITLSVVPVSYYYVAIGLLLRAWAVVEVARVVKPG